MKNLKHIKIFEDFKIKDIISEPLLLYKSKTTLSDFPYVINFFKKYYPEKNILNIPVYIISDKEWPNGKTPHTESDLKGGIRIHENWYNGYKEGTNFEKKIGWMVHETGHVFHQKKKEKRQPLLEPKNYNTYMSENFEASANWYQFQYMISIGLSEEDVVKYEKLSYEDVKGGGNHWSPEKETFIRDYYRAIDAKLKSFSHRT